MNLSLLADDEEFKRRLEICRGCDRFEPRLSRCLECGCFANVKAKISFMKCPLEKWGPKFPAP